MNFKRLFAGLFIGGCLLLFFGISGFDEDPFTRIITALNNWSLNHPQEKLYLQLDRSYYAAGEDIWFKAYATIGPGHKLSTLSGVVNVDLIDGRDSIKQSIKLPLINGLTWGDFELPDTLKAGNYRIRAYTNWMRNAGSAWFFDKAIVINNAVANNVFTHASYRYNSQNNQLQITAAINYADLAGKPYSSTPVSYRVKLGDKDILNGKGTTDDKGGLEISFTNPDPNRLKSGSILTELKQPGKTTIKKAILIKSASTQTDVQFFPEGGSLVNGNNTKIAFKALGADGLGSDIKGVVTDNDNNQVAAFSSSHLGMGTFNLDPKNGKSYKAKITYADGSQGEINLPTATNNGYSLSIDNSDAKNIRVKILPGAKISAASSPNETIALLAQSGGVAYFEGKSKPGSKSFTANIPKDKFPTGIAQFTLFSSSGEPLNERLVFIRRHDELRLDVGPQQTYAPMQLVNIDLAAKDKDGKPAVGSFSVAVTNETKVPVDEDSENGILANLLLTSDIRGYIEKPGYYFNIDNEKTNADLDALMLTQGYHRFEWKDVLGNAGAPVRFQPEKTLTISGHLRNLLGKPVANGKVTLFSTKGGIFMVDTTSDNQGNFIFKHLIFKDSVRFVIQARTAKDHKNVEVDIDNVRAAPSGESKAAADFLVNYNDGLSPFLQSSKEKYDSDVKYGIINNSIMLKEVVVKDKKEDPIKNSSNLNGPGNADQVIKADDNMLSGCGNIADCLQGRIPGVIFRNDTPFSSPSHRPMEIVLDGLSIDGSVLASLNPGDIASVEVLRTIQYTSIYGGRGSSGVLIITSKTGDADAGYERYTPGIISYMPKGYAKVKEFYSPKYDDPKTNAQIPDLRSTIYWKPNIVTSNDGKASFQYFNSDEKGTYRVVIEGIDANGNLGRLVYRYKVE